MNREPAVAGSFYPSDPKLLHITKVSEFVFSRIAVVHS